jgi:hypothetical protein
VSIQDRQQENHVQGVLQVKEARAGGSVVDWDEGMTWGEESHCVDERGVVGAEEGLARGHAVGHEEEGVVVVVAEEENYEGVEEAEAGDHGWAVEDHERNVASGNH